MTDDTFEAATTDRTLAKAIDRTARRRWCAGSMERRISGSAAED